MEAVRSVDVFSPNHIELLSLFGYAEVDFRKGLVEDLAFKMLEAGVGPQGKGVVVVRAAEHGCLVTSRSISPVWLPPFYGAERHQNSRYHRRWECISGRLGDWALRDRRLRESSSVRDQ